MQTQTHELTFTATQVHKRFVSWDDGEAEREWTCLSFLAEHAPGLAPRPLRRETAADGAPILVLERLPGEPLGGSPLTPGQTRSLGRSLRRMYDLQHEELSASMLAERRHGPTTLPGVLVQWLREGHDLSACRDPALVADGVDAALAWLEQEGSLPEPRLVSLGIADLNPANVLWDGTDCRLVDFEDGGLTDPGYELADHVEHLAGRLSGAYDAVTLADAVGLDPEEEQRMAAYRPLWAGFWLVMLLPGNGGFRRNPPGTTEDQARHFLSLSARG